jgi:hypothetical protein
MALIDPPYAFDASNTLIAFLLDNVLASHFEQLAFPTLTERPIAVISATVLQLLATLEKLQAYPPTCMALNNPPYEFTP